MWGYFGDFVSLLRNIPAYRDLPLAELLPAVFPDLTFVRVVRANKVRQAVSLWKAVQTATWRREAARGLGERRRRRGRPAVQSFIEEHRPELRFHYRAIEHLLDQILVEEASWDAFFEHTGIKPFWCCTRTSPPTGPVGEPCSTAGAGAARVSARAAHAAPVRRLNDDWARRYRELRLGTQFDLVPAKAA